MENIKYYTTPELKNPTMIACWTGMGNVGFSAADYIRIKLKTKLLAETDLSDLVSPEVISVSNGVSSIEKASNLSVYFSKTPPLIISIGREQFYGKAGIATMGRLLEIASKFKVKKIFTCAAFPAYMSHRGRPAVYAAANSTSLIKELKDKQNLHIMEDGRISGLNGLMLEASRKKKIDAACLLATLPMYAISFPNPRASKALIKTLQKIIGFDIDTTDLDLSMQEIDKMLENIEEQLKQLGMEENKGQERPVQKEHDELPKSILDKIERLFEEAKQDKKMAHKLKEELDRWNLFKLYEDRFLDLFRENQ
jgi:proteasome assembly chaperone (PAC2) family protein